MGGHVADPEAAMERVVEKFILPARLDAVIAPNDITAAYMMRALLARGVRIPDDVALVGTDNEPFSGALTPGLTTIDDNSELIARYAVEMLLEDPDADGPRVVKTVKVTPRVVVRESTGPLPEA